MLKFYICRICGNLIEMIEDSGIVPLCCGDDMDELIPGSTDGAKEKHIPVYTELSDSEKDPDSHPHRKTLSVKVGSLLHPMTDDHRIEWIAVLTDEGVYRRKLKNSPTAQADFYLPDKETVKAIYAYCNLHGLWINVTG